MMGERNLMMRMPNLMMQKIITGLLIAASIIYVYTRIYVVICSKICRICHFLARFSHFLGSGVTLYIWSCKSRLKRKFVQSLHRWFNLL